MPNRCEAYEFGYNQVYNGVGVFVYQYEDKLRVVAQQDLGAERVDMRLLSRKLLERLYGCEIGQDQINWNLKPD